MAIGPAMLVRCAPNPGQSRALEACPKADVGHGAKFKNFAHWKATDFSGRVLVVFTELC